MKIKVLWYRVRFYYSIDIFSTGIMTKRRPLDLDFQSYHRIRIILKITTDNDNIDTIVKKRAVVFQMHRVVKVKVPM